MSIGKWAIVGVLAGVFSFVAGAEAQTSSQPMRMAQVSPAPDQSFQRPPRRLRIYPRYRADDVYPRYYPGPNAVRVCTASYVQEYRPSGTVIVPRMSCVWQPG